MKGLRKWIFFTGIFILAAGITIFYVRGNICEYKSVVFNLTNLENWIKSFGKMGVIVFLLLQILQVVVFFIPGEIIQAAGGYLYGAFMGAALSISGILIGSTITFILARLYGTRFLSKILPEGNYGKIKKLILKPRNKLIIFILYLLPGFPKDILGYVSGITAIKFGSFIIISSVGRAPALFLSSYFGANLYYRNYIAIIYISAAIGICLLLGIIYREKILSRLG